METKPYEFNPADYAEYRFQVTHDTGKFNMRVLARSEAQGRERIRNNEKCPDRAIKTLFFSPMRKFKK